MIRVFTGVARSRDTMTPSVEIPVSVKRRVSSWPASSRPTTPTGVATAPRARTLSVALAAPPSRTSRSVKRRMRTGASREMRAGLPKRYSSAMRSPTTAMRLPGKRASASLSRRTGNTSAPRAPDAGERPVHRVEQIRGHVVRLDLSAGRPRLPLPETVAGEHEHARGARRLARRHVGELVAHHDGGAQIEAEIGGRAREEPGARLAAVAVGPVRRPALTRVVHADVEAVEARATGLELADHAAIGRVQRLLGEVPAGDTRLIRDHHRGDPRLVEPADRRRGARQQVDPARVVDVAHLLRETAVAVHEHGGPQMPRVARH